jgi:hypothetical protein
MDFLSKRVSLVDSFLVIVDASVVFAWFIIKPLCLGKNNRTKLFPGSDQELDCIATSQCHRWVI